MRVAVITVVLTFQGTTDGVVVGLWALALAAAIAALADAISGFLE